QAENTVPAGQGAGRRHPRHFPGDRQRTIEPGKVIAFDRGHDDGNQRLFKIVMAARRVRVLSNLRSRNPSRNGEINRRTGFARLRRQKCADHFLGCGSRQNSTARFFQFSPAARLSAHLDRQRNCARCDLDIRPPSPGLFSFNSPLGACPECRGFGRTIAIDLNKAIPDRSLSIKQGVVRVFRGAEFGESQKDLLRACAREEIDINVPFEELPKADQDFVIEGEKRSDDYTDDDYENDRWYGVRGFFRWLESKTYKMHE